MVAQKGRFDLSVPKPIPLNGKATPELLPIARMAFETLARGKRVLEFGSGHSTVWLAELGCDVVTVENERNWYDAVKRWLYERDLTATQILCEDVTVIMYAANDYPDECFDVLFIDGEWYNRVEFMAENIQRLKPGGWVIFDDSNWERFYGIQTILKDWALVEVSGMHHRKTGLTKWVQTSFYRKPCSL